MKILSVDDDWMILELLELAMSVSGHAAQRQYQSKGRLVAGFTASKLRPVRTSS
jgi:DNA-binding response OmpR family regulator